MIRRLIIAAITALAALSCTTVSQEQARQAERAREVPRARYSSDAGGEPVGVVPEAVLRDEERNRDVVMAIDYPTSAGPHPLIVFSHAFGGSHRSYVGLASYWASRGYVVVRPQHADAQAAPDATTIAEAWEQHSEVHWRDRVRDVTFVLDSLGRLAERYMELEGKIDGARVGVGGHGHGAFTALLIGGGRMFPGGVSFADPRVKAVMLMSPQGPSELRGLTRQSWDELRMPALFMTGTRDTGIDETETPEWRRQGFDLAPAGDKWLVVIRGARHASFTGRTDLMLDEEAKDLRAERERMLGMPLPRSQAGTMSEQMRGLFGRVRSISLAFWDAYLRDDPEGRESLERAEMRFGVAVEKR